MNTRFEKRFSSGLYFLTSYTWQKSLDLGSTDEFSAVGSSFKTLDKGHSSFDVPHRLVFSYVWELPFGKGKRFGGGRPDAGQDRRRLAVFGHQHFFQGPVPDSGCWRGLAEYRELQFVAAEHRRRLHSGAKLSRTRTSTAAAFDYPRNAAGKPMHIPGNAARNSIEQPGLNNWDLGRDQEHAYSRAL